MMQTKLVNVLFALNAMFFRQIKHVTFVYCLIVKNVLMKLLVPHVSVDSILQKINIVSHVP